MEEGQGGQAQVLCVLGQTVVNHDLWAALLTGSLEFIVDKGTSGAHPRAGTVHKDLGD